MPKLTKLGLALRTIRIGREQRLFDMAQKLGISSAQLSSVEMGYAVPDMNWLPVLRDWLELDPAHVRNFKKMFNEAIERGPIKRPEPPKNTGKGPWCPGCGATHVPTVSDHDPTRGGFYCGECRIFVSVRMDADERGEGQTDDK